MSVTATKPRIVPNEALLITLCVVSLTIIIGINTNLIPFGIPGMWVWPYKPNLQPMRMCFPLVGLGLLLATIRFPIRTLLSQPLTKSRELGALSALWLSTFSISIGVALTHIWGWMYIAALVLNIGPNSYYFTALRHPNLSALLNGFDQQMVHLPLHAQTQSAGPIVLCWALRRLFGYMPFLNDIADVLFYWSVQWNSQYTAEYWGEIMDLSFSPTDASAALMVGLFFMAVGSLTVFPLYFLGKRLYRAQVGIWAAVIFALVPSFHLFTATVDQMYPLFTVLALYLLTRGLSEPRRGWLFFAAAGLVLSVAVFISLGLLTLVVLCALYALLILLKKQKEISKRAVGTLMVAFTGGLTLPWLLLWLVFRYDIFAVFLTSNYLRNKLYADLNRSYVSSVWGNMQEFLISIGVPLALLFLWHLYKSGSAVVRRSTSVLKNPLLWSFFFLLIVLDVSGKALGEVARLWIFLAPCVVLASAGHVREVTTQGRPWSQVLILCQVLQLITFPYFLRVHGF